MNNERELAMKPIVQESMVHNARVSRDHDYCPSAATASRPHTSAFRPVPQPLLAGGFGLRPAYTMVTAKLLTLDRLSQIFET